jgi:hypothetical protein
MKNIFLICFFLNFSNTGFGQSKYAEYCDSTFKFCITYPAYLLNDPIRIDAGNINLTAQNGLAKISIWASRAEEAMEPSLGFKSLYIGAAYSRNITYEVVKKDWFVLSGYTESEDVFYHKTVLKNDIVYNILLEYPVKERKVWDAQCGKIANSLIVNGLTKVK